MNATATMPAPFVFDKDYHNVEQVRPFYAGYLLRLAQLNAEGQYPYNDSFRDRIPSLATTDPKNEDTAIYLLQTMHSLDALAATLSAFVTGGGVTPDGLAPGAVWRGTVAEYGFYMGGTGWKTTPDARLMRDTRGRLIIIEKGKRNGRYASDKVLIQKNGVTH